MVSACPNAGRAPEVPYATIQCLTGAASHLFGGGTPIVVHGQVLHRLGNVTYLQRRDGESAVTASGPKALVARILSTVQPTGGDCSA